MKHVYIFFILLLPAINCFSQWSKDSLVRNPVCTSPNNQYASRSCPDGTGGAYFTWVDERIVTSPSIFIQKINVKGKKAWATNGKIVFTGSTSASAVNTTIVDDGNGGAIIIYEISVIGGDNQLWAQHINATGTLLWGSGVRITDAPDARLRWIENPTQDGISADGSGGAFITWQAYQMPYFNYVQHIDANGNLVWGTTGVPLLPVGTLNGYLTVITSTGNGTAVAGFTDYVSGVYYYYLQKINANGSYAWSNTGVQISGTIDAGESTGFKVIYDAATSSVLTAFLTGSGFATNCNVQKLDLNGNILWTAGGVNTTNLSSTYVATPDLLADGKGGMFLSSVINGKVNVQHVNTKGKITWGAAGTTVDNTSFGSQYNPSLVSDGGTGFIITYNTSRTFSTSGYPIYAQHYTAAGAAKWQNGGVAVMVNNTNINHEVPYTIASTKGFAITCWQDDRNNSTSGNDIYAARFGGITGMSLQTVQDEASATAKSVGNTIASINTYPNPATNDVAISFVLNDSAANVSVSIYNTTGEKVKYVELGNLQAGKQLLHINTHYLPNGVYDVVIVYAAAKQEAKIIISR